MCIECVGTSLRSVKKKSFMKRYLRFIAFKVKYVINTFHVNQTRLRESIILKRYWGFILSQKWHIRALYRKFPVIPELFRLRWIICIYFFFRRWCLFSYFNRKSSWKLQDVDEVVYSSGGWPSIRNRELKDVISVRS